MKKMIALFLCITLTGSVSVFAEQVNSPNNRDSGFYKINIERTT